MADVADGLTKEAGDPRSPALLRAVSELRMGVAPPGWQEAAGFYGDAGCYSAADVDGAESLAKVREYKRAAKAEAKAKAKAKATAAKP